MGALLVAGPGAVPMPACDFVNINVTSHDIITSYCHYHARPGDGGTAKKTPEFSAQRRKVNRSRNLDVVLRSMATLPNGGRRCRYESWLAMASWRMGWQNCPKGQTHLPAFCWTLASHASSDGLAYHRHRTPGWTGYPAGRLRCDRKRTYGGSASGRNLHRASTVRAIRN